MYHDALFKWPLKDPVILGSFFEEFLPEVAKYYDEPSDEARDDEIRRVHLGVRSGPPLILSELQTDSGENPEARTDIEPIAGMCFRPMALRQQLRFLAVWGRVSSFT